ncbi:MAG: UDP-N-acetylmuramoyl-tripeptide--D-alanyl-D-alanine ligase, partial [Candidatus Hydrothermae bacterium]|nr:UDP-N-acetylmuramoyl-tripeptide--D-alanyl-D-alanine ligase [Candidatus Hydrothermae bacterium]
MTSLFHHLHLTLPRLREVLGGTLIHADPHTSVIPHGISVDTRHLRPGDLFVALKGTRTDGHRFVEEAFQRGAAAAVVREPQPLPQPQIVVASTEEALVRLGTFLRARLKVREVIGITGSVGKTTTKEWLAELLSLRYRVHKSPKSYNNRIGLPLALAATPPDAEILVLELGTNHPGELPGLVTWVRPTLGILTHIGPSHLAFFGTVEAVAREKAALFAALPPGSHAFLNRRIPAPLHDLVRSRVPEGVHLHRVPPAYRWDGQRLTLESHTLLLPFPSRGLVDNLLIAYAVARHLGVPEDLLLEHLPRMTPVPGRHQVIRLGTHRVVFDAYNANPLSMQELLETYRAHADRTLLILGDMLELGDAADRLHQEVGRQAARLGYAALIAVGDHAAAMARGAREEGMREVVDMPSVETLLSSNALTMARMYPYVLLKASRSLAFERILEVL